MKLVPRPPARATSVDRSIPITFGPFNGRPVCELPDAYLYALVQRRLWPVLARAVEAELEYRAAGRKRAG